MSSFVCVKCRPAEQVLLQPRLLPKLAFGIVFQAAPREGVKGLGVRLAQLLRARAEQLAPVRPWCEGSQRLLELGH